MTSARYAWWRRSSVAARSRSGRPASAVDEERGAPRVEGGVLVRHPRRQHGARGRRREPRLRDEHGRLERVGHGRSAPRGRHRSPRATRSSRRRGAPGRRCRGVPRTAWRGRGRRRRSSASGFRDEPPGRERAPRRRRPPRTRAPARAGSGCDSAGGARLCGAPNMVRDAARNARTNRWSYRWAATPAPSPGPPRPDVGPARGSTSIVSRRPSARPIASNAGPEVGAGRGHVTRTRRARCSRRCPYPPPKRARPVRAPAPRRRCPRRSRRARAGGRRAPSPCP